jgi:hypothetical protein
MHNLVWCRAFAVARAPYFGIQRACFVFCVGVCVLWLLASGFVALQTKESKFRAGKGL